jgi:hypothetical protein
LRPYRILAHTPSIPLISRDAIIMNINPIFRYFINYSPFDFVYKIARFLPFKIVLYMLKEVQRTKKIFDGVTIAAKLYPGSYIIIVLIGVVKGKWKEKE